MRLGYLKYENLNSNRNRVFYFFSSMGFIDCIFVVIFYI